MRRRMSPDIVDDRLEILAFGVCNTDGIEGLTWVNVDQCQVCKNKHDHQKLVKTVKLLS